MDPILLAIVGGYAAAGGGSLIAATALLSAGKASPEKPEAKPEPLYVGKPKALKPADRVYGACRFLIQGQRAWLADEARAQVAAQLDGDALRAAGNVFADWFETRVVIPANATASDVIPFNDWAADYVNYCDEHSISRMSDVVLHAHMDTYAKAYNCSLDAQGNYHGGHLKQ